MVDHPTMLGPRDAVLTLKEQAAVDRLAGIMCGMIEAEAGANGEPEGSLMALGSIVGGLRWLEDHGARHRYTARLLAHLHAEATVAAVLQDAPAASEVHQ
jgi:hypothetical protein